MLGGLVGGRGRDLFRYRVGGRRLSADPVEVYARLDAAGGPGWPELFRAAATRADGLPTMPPQFRAKIRRQRAAAARDLARLSREAFGLPVVADGLAGVTDVEAADVLMDFLAFCGRLAERVKVYRDMAAAGLPLPAGLSYPEVVGLWLSRHEIAKAHEDRLAAVFARAGE